MNEKLAAALGHVDPVYVTRAAKRKSRRSVWITAAAAVLILVFLLNIPSIPLVVAAQAVSLAPDARKTERPEYGTPEFEAWIKENSLRDHNAKDILPALMAFSGSGSALLLNSRENALWSPVNAYIGLAMTAELVTGQTKAEVMGVLGARDNGQLRSGISALWESVYRDNGKEVSVLANSLWLDDATDYNQDVMDAISHHYYASVYRGELGSEKTNRAIGAWLSNETGGFLKNRTDKVALSRNALLALVSTVYFQAQWSDEFSRDRTDTGVFHSPSGDLQVTYLNAKRRQMYYYWGEDYAAVALPLKNGSSMWLILPDSDKTLGDVLESGEYIAHFTDPGGENSKYMKVNLSVPKFDVAAGTDLKPALQAMGLERIFDIYCPDFVESIYADTSVYLESVRQDSRVAIDEEGVIAASYIILDFGAGSAMPPEEEIDLVLDRPFLFAITHSGIPLFMGAVNEP